MSSLRDFQLVLLDILLILDKFLNENNIKYYLVGGSALGAVRHNGFIPWDDDIDIGMPREDFERFEALDFSRLEERGLLYCSIGKNVIQNAPIGYLYDRRDPESDIRKCPTIDIFPIDYIPNSNFKRKMQKLWSFVYHLSTSRLPAQNRGKKAYAFTKTIILLTPKFMFRLYAKLARHNMLSFGKNPTENVANIFGMKGYNKEIMPENYLSDTVLYEFEGHMLPIPVMYNEYLTHLFGDYMTPPPRDEQNPHHKQFD